MELNECNIKNIKNIGNWSNIHKYILVCISSFVLIIGFYPLVLEQRVDELALQKEKEKIIKLEYKNKAALSSNLDLYKKQLDEIRLLLDDLVKKLPSNSEIATLLDDLSLIGASHGLKFNSINWGDKIDNRLFIEIPISMSLVGTYEQLGKFSQEIAKLPRIINLEEIKITKFSDEKLQLNLVAKTYSYKEPSE